MGSVVALEYLKQPEKFPIPPFCVLFGDELFLRAQVFQALRAQVLTDDEADFSLTKYDGTTVPYLDVLREVSTAAMFGSGRRLVVVEQADSFLSQNKERLEAYLDEPSKAGALVLQLASFPSNLRLYKKASAVGLVIDCKALRSKDVLAWLIDWAPQKCGASLARDAAQELIDSVGEDLGSLDQETRRLALSTPSGKIDVKLVREQVGAWRRRKVWDMLDAALDGDAPDALRQLDKLLSAGEAPIAILAQIAATLRRFAAATQLFEEIDPSTRSTLTLSSALSKVGTPPFARAKNEAQLKKLGARRAKKLASLLLQADVDLKGGSRIEPRLILERFLVQISDPQLR